MPLIVNSAVDVETDWQCWNCDDCQCDGDEPATEAGRPADGQHADERGHPHRQVKHCSAAAGKLEPSTRQGNAPRRTPSTDAGRMHFLLLFCSTPHF